MLKLTGIKQHDVLLVVILTFGLGLRLYGIDWGISSLEDFGRGNPGLSVEAASFHPDANTLAQATASLRDSIHPRVQVGDQQWLYSVYGPVFMYLYQGSAWLFGLVAGFSPFDSGDPDSVDKTRLAGRAVSALAGSATLWLVYRLSTLAFGAPVGLLASLLLGATALHIQSSHFATVDVLMAFWATWSFLPMVRIALGGHRNDYIVAGLLIALATVSTSV